MKSKYFVSYVQKQFSNPNNYIFSNTTIESEDDDIMRAILNFEFELNTKNDNSVSTILSINKIG